MKNKQKGFVVPLIIAIIAILTIGGVAFVTTNKKVEAPVVDDPTQISTTTPIVGGDRDIHGCIGSAGYSWCAEKNKCLRVWEEPCEIISTSTQATSTDKVECTTSEECMEVSCPGNGGFAHQICVQGKCIFASGVKEMCTSVNTDPIACTADAMLCPDGSYVGRTGPNCEFVCSNN